MSPQKTGEACSEAKRRGSLQDSFHVSRRRACGLLDLHRSTYHYRPRAHRDELLATALRSHAAKRRRWGYRRLLLLLRRDGWTDNHKRVYRVYRQQCLQVRRRRRRRTAASRGQLPMPAVGFNHRNSNGFQRVPTVETVAAVLDLYSPKPKPVRDRSRAGKAVDQISRPGRV